MSYRGLVEYGYGHPSWQCRSAILVEGLSREYTSNGKDKALGRINSILRAWGWGTTFGHSFRIGGASFYLAQKVNPEIVRLAGRWKSLAYEAHIRAFELIGNRHMGNMDTHPSSPHSVEQT